jgi:L-aspartate oxidase
MRTVVDNTMAVRTDDVVVVGSGIGGLVCALSLAPKSVTLITKTEQPDSGSSVLAQGGIAAAIGPDDSPEAHAADTLSAGAGLSDPQRTRELTDEGAASLNWLLQEGIAFDRDLEGGLSLAKEAAHQFPRVVHAGGDATGQVLVQGLIKRAREERSIRIAEKAFAWDLVVRQGRIVGLVAFHEDAGWVFHKTENVVLATGGIGRAWWHSTNPVESTGDGLAMAARAGAKLANLEFVQFHPTALAVEGNDGARLPLLTEALRGAGARLVDAQGRRFMLSEHPLAELAPRDVVARAIHRRTRAGEYVGLDIRDVLSGPAGGSFPQAVQTAKDAGIDPYREPLPITPAAHYHMGGVEVDVQGRSSIPGLWACGEVSTTGIHGANRLASNSLLEALVYARRVAAGLNALTRPPQQTSDVIPELPALPERSTLDSLQALQESVRRIMTQDVGILRNGVELESAYAILSEIEDRLLALGGRGNKAIRADAHDVECWGETRNLALVARLVAFAALRREESRGAHFRDDYPQPSSKWRHQQSLTVESLREAH